MARVTGAATRVLAWHTSRTGEVTDAETHRGVAPIAHVIATPADLARAEDPMSIDDFIERVRTTRTDAAGSSFLVFTTASKELFHGEIVETPPDALLLRQADGVEVLIMRAHVVAIMPATS
jgi:hypothetical protein